MCCWTESKHLINKSSPKADFGISDCKLVDCPGLKGSSVDEEGEVLHLAHVVNINPFINKYHSLFKPMVIPRVSGTVINLMYRSSVRCI